MRAKPYPPIAHVKAKVSKRRGHHHEIVNDERNPTPGTHERSITFTGTCVVTFESNVEWASVRALALSRSPQVSLFVRVYTFFVGFLFPA